MQETPINTCRRHSQLRLFVDLDSKKIFMISHKCGVALYEHLLSKTYLNKMDFLQPIPLVHRVGNWYVLIEMDEVSEFVRQHDETEYSKMMITRNPYDRLTSFYANSFWDHALKKNYRKDKLTHYETYSLVYGERYNEVVDQIKTGDFQKGFNIFMDAVFLNPTPGTLKERETNDGYGNIHLIPQSDKYRQEGKAILTDIKFVDIKDGIPQGKHANIVLEFLDIEDMIKQPLNLSSMTKEKHKTAWQYFSPEALEVVNEIYHFDFEDFGYDKH